MADKDDREPSARYNNKVPTRHVTPEAKAALKFADKVKKTKPKTDGQRGLRGD